MQSADPDVPQRPNKCHQETKMLPHPLCFSPAVGPRVSRPVQIGERAPHEILPLHPFPTCIRAPVPAVEKDQPYFNDVISTKARARVEGWRGPAARLAKCYVEGYQNWSDLLAR